MDRFDYIYEIDELMDSALSELSPREFDKLKEYIIEMIENYNS